MRGQVWCGRNFSLLRRITPEDAGTSYPSNLFHNVIKDHPRGCGDKPDAFVLHYHLGGSPPRMRGQESRTVTSRVIQRITPADAGTSLDPRIRLYSPEDHPRGCGDKNYFSINFYWFIGSPPRMRGQVIPPGLSLSRCWITPADAGTSLLQPFPGKVPQDHPRGCGDKVRKASLAYCSTGSPPRMRGQDSIRYCLRLQLGITPADAGTSEQHSGSSGVERDHPRGCGDKNGGNVPSHQYKGSPPRMRGQVSFCSQDNLVVGITPADAGTRFWWLPR